MIMQTILLFKQFDFGNLFTTLIKSVKFGILRGYKHIL